MSTVIKPTVGRIVYLYVSADTSVAPRAAIIAKVIDDKLVNIAAFGEDGTHHPMVNVPLAQEGETAEGAHVRWMPYQIGQAKAAAPAATVSQQQQNNPSVLKK